MVVVLQLTAPLVALLVVAALRRFAWWPRAVARAFARQGIRGPSYTFLAGSLPEAKRLVIDGRRGVPPLDVGCHDIMPILLPQFHRWAADYGRTFLHWMGPIPALFSTDLELIKEVLTDRTGVFAKDFMIPVLKVILGNGLLLANGEEWKRHRKVVLPAFNHERIKSMAAVAAEATERMAQRWCDQIQRSGAHQAAEIEADRDIADLTTEIIGRVAFGTSHELAGEIIHLMEKMQAMATAATLEVAGPILWFMPTRRNRTVQRLDKLLRTKIMEIMEGRLALAAKNKDDANNGGGRGGSNGGDLLGLMLEAWSPEGQDGKLTSKEVIEECKTFFAAGQETIANLIIWTMFLLSTNPQWQERVREEVLREFRGVDSDSGAVRPSTDVLARLKLLHMVLLEALRLYPPAAYIQRKAISDVVVRGIKVPQGTVISIPIVTLHRDKEVWGSDALEFNPMRFKNGVARAAKDPNALLTFAIGPRACIGQSFAIVEAQVVVATILSKFSLSLSPAYIHKPKFAFTLVPNRGMPLVLRSLQD